MHRNFLSSPFQQYERIVLTPFSRTHTNRHKRPFRCEFEGCARKNSGFATKDELKRHNEAHKRHNGDQTIGPFNCSESGCPRTAALGNDRFTRKYPLREHLRRAHPETPLPPDLIPRTAKTLSASNLTETFTTSPEHMNQSFAVPDMRKRKRTSANNVGTQEASQDSGDDVSTPNNPNKARLGNETMLMLHR
jgi:hypothetical protein